MIAEVAPLARERHIARNHRRMLGPEPTGNIVDDWLNIGYTFIPFEPPAGAIQAVLQGFQNLLAQKSFKELERWGFGDPEDKDTGFISRVDENGIPLSSEYANDGQKNDNKFLWQYRPSIISQLDNNRVYYKPERDWLESCHTLYSYCRKRSLECQEIIDSDTMLRLGDGHAQRFQTSIAEEEHTLRVISYLDDVLPQAKLCAGHTDRCWSTIAVHETYPALKLITRQKQTVDYVPIPEQALFFPGKKAPDVTGKVLDGTFHYCQVPDGFVPPENVGRRYAIIFFAHEAAPHIHRLREYGDGTRTDAELQAYRAEKAAKKKLREDIQKHQIKVDK